MSKKPKMYTATGDDGYTGLLGKGRVPKYDLRPEAYGQVDELQAAIGFCRANITHNKVQKDLETIERELYIMMGELATAPGVEMEIPKINEKHVDKLGHITDAVSEELPPITNFVLPGNSEMGARLHLARTAARRAERAVVRLFHETSFENKQVLRYLNRLSSYLFSLACYEDLVSAEKGLTYSKQP